MEAWDITVDESRRPDGTKSCAGGWLLPDQKTVWVVGGGPDIGFGTTTDFAKALHAELEAQCLNLDEAAELPRSIAASTPDDVVPGYEPTVILDGLKIESVVDPAASCTRANVRVGGSLFVILRGPST